MPLVDLTNNSAFEAYYNKGTNIWLIEHPTTGVRAVWIQGQGPQPFHTTFDKRKEVRVHYVRALELNAARHRAKVLTAAVGLTATERVAIIGAGFGWLQEALEEQLPGIECVSVETSSWIQSVKDQTETAELDILIQEAGILPIEAGYDAAMARLNDGGFKARRELTDEDVTSGQGRAKIKAKVKPKGVPTPFTWAVSEHTLEWLDDAEAQAVDAGMHALAPNVCHLLREYDPRQARHTEPGYKSNWKWLSSTNDGVKQELTDLPWYTVDSWQALLNADSVLVGV
ncbi:hypothetical protein LCGC14_1735060 [marine sediment metagenome]|uniref:Uncharacterized protein n=1 Tax=marine sediment metagenome TaxID=412755 RepID=A0A0F9H8E1_9ZZZZ